MRKIGWIITVSLFAGYFLNLYFTDKANEKAIQIEQERVEQSIKQASSTMIARNNAISDWVDILNNEKTPRLEPIRTIELEKLWVNQRPIFFTGVIKDISTKDDFQYVVTIERSIFNSSNHFLGTTLRLSLHSKKSVIDAFLNKYPNFFREGEFNNGIAVVARINSIRSNSIQNEQAEQEEIRIGEGDLLEILHIGRLHF